MLHADRLPCVRTGDASLPSPRLRVLVLGAIPAGETPLPGRRRARRSAAERGTGGGKDGQEQGLDKCTYKNHCVKSCVQLLQTQRSITSLEPLVLVLCSLSNHTDNFYSNGSHAKIVPGKITGGITSD